MISHITPTPKPTTINTNSATPIIASNSDPIATLEIIDRTDAIAQATIKTKNVSNLSIIDSPILDS